MPMRVAIGDYASGFLGRASRAGFDAAWASSEELLFNADDVPIRWLGGGARAIDGNRLQEQTSSEMLFGSATFPHGIAGNCTILAVARSLGIYQSPTTPHHEPYNWFAWETNSNPSPKMLRVPHPNANFNGSDRYVGPFYLNTDLPSTVGVRVSGYDYTWDGTNITVKVYSPNDIWFRWEAWGV